MKKYILLLSIISCYSCYNTDFNETQISRIEQTVISSETLKPIVGLKVYLLNSEIKIDSTTTDKNGHYAFDVFSISDNRDYQQMFATKQYERDPGYGIEKTFYLAPISWLRIHVKNTTPFDDNDQIELDAYPSFTEQIKGKDVNKTIVMKLRYDTGYRSYMGYTVKKNAKRVYTKINITPISFDTLDININY